jgi:sortase A
MIRGAARWVQRISFVAGFMILGYCGADWWNSSLRQAQGNQELDRILSYKPANPIPPAVVKEGGLVGKVEIPRLHLSAVVFQGTEVSVLDHGVGHLDGSPMPGEAGNVVFAAHRDTFFRSLRDIEKGDVITVTTPSGPRSYSVDSTEIVDPTQTSVLNATERPTLTLITCYPFYYVGNAPKRFIVRALDTQKPLAPVKIITAKKEAARKAPPVEKVSTEEAPPSPQTPEETAELTYIFKASQ